MRGPPIESGTVKSYQDWSITAFADGQVNRSGGSWDERDHCRFVAFADDPQGPVAAVEAKIIDVRVACFAVPQPVQAEQDCQSSVLTVDAFGGEQEPSEFGAVESVALVGWTLGRRTYWAGLA